MPFGKDHVIVDDLSLIGRLRSLSWGLIALVSLIAGIGFLSLYSAANGNLDPWASQQMIRFIFFFGVMVAIGLTDIRWIYRAAWPAYGGCILLLIFVQLFGHVGMGAQRWLDLGVMKLQPSELMKLTTIMVLARYFHGMEAQDIPKFRTLLFPILIIAVPFVLIVTQPNLGTALTLAFAAVAVLFVAGISIWVFIAGGVAVGSAIPIVWHFLHDYQKRRVLTFLNPENDPLGMGFHITQSKIALGSGGLFGKGFLQGSQSHLNFLPEKHTDFIFTLWAEEWGLIGGLLVFVLLALIFLYGYFIAFRSRHVFGRLLAFGLMINFCVYIFVNVAMVMGLIPVVGIPFPLMSYGGTSMLAVMIGFGMILAAHVGRDARLPKEAF
jgi:rod shape determining protein RodA